MDLWDVVVAPRAKQPIVGEALRDLEAKLRERFMTFAMEHMPQAALVVQLQVEAESEEGARAAAVLVVEEAAKECQLEVRPAATHVRRVKV
jgi:hypothetical protein